MAHTQSKKSAKPRRNFHNPQQNDSELLDDQASTFQSGILLFFKKLREFFALKIDFDFEF